ncbi:DUF4442 domain-containing protein [Permianibacter aggregans]|uniref:Uncharacterized protein DUF4442 n=1 Tax=Permianibacter aggregans TaxID=1510150 RepID=A0A4R6UQZ0_9GAMM|nr:DUF4442 domain-containing protein [Permianibacter aggregans]QGX39579.1 DUF4442 domain-containing protein [Permianibacter aggregans]TDQ49670.1 uncharacterized protein DUF4442 [Permianibacter aggregans]
MHLNHRWFRILLNIWSPFRGAGIKVRSVSPDFRHVIVDLKAPRWKRNYVGTHFGGSLYAMTDPFYMLMLMRNLGRDYWVWDKTASIDYLTAASGVVSAHFRLSEGQIQAIRDATATGDKHLPEFHIDIVDAQGTVVARVHRTLYVRLKKDRRPSA